MCCSEVIEHVDNQEEFIRNVLKLVKPGTGQLFLSTIAKTPESYFLTILSKFLFEPQFLLIFSGRICDQNGTDGDP